MLPHTMSELSDGHNLPSEGRFSEAIQACQATLQSEPHNLAAREALCRFAQQIGDYQEFIQRHLECAEICSLRGDRDSAMEHYQTILRLREPTPGVPSESMEAIGQLVNALPPVIYYELGEYLRENGYLDLALQYLRKSQDGARDWRTHLALGRALMAQGDARNAQGEFQEALRLGPIEPDGYMHIAALAPAYEHMAAIMLRHHPGNQVFEGFLEQALGLYEKAGDLTGATRCRLRLSDEWRGPLDPEEVLDKVHRLYRHGQHEQAQQVLELACSQHPRQAELAFRLGEAYAAAGRDRQASQCFVRVTQLDVAEFYGAAYESAADALRRLEIKPEEVIRLYEQAVQAYTACVEEEAAARCRHKLLS